MSGSTVFPFLGSDQFRQLGGAAMQASNPDLTDLTPGSIELALVDAATQVAVWQQMLIALGIAVTRLSSSNAGDVDTFVGDFGLYRLPAVASTGSVSAYRTSAANVVSIPVGTIIKTIDLTQTFIITIDATNANYDPVGIAYTMPYGINSITIPVAATVAGTSGNVAAGALGLINSPISGVDSYSNAVAITNGIDAESDDALKARFSNYINSRSQATRSAVAYAIQSVQQGLTYYITENQDALGNHVDGMFVAFVDDGSGHPSTTLLNTIRAAVDLVRPIGTVFAILPPRLLLANINVSVIAASGYDQQAVEQAVGTTVTAYIDALLVGAPLPYLRLAQIIYDTQGVASIVPGTLLLNGVTVDIGGTGAQTVRIGTLTVGGS